MINKTFQTDLFGVQELTVSNKFSSTRYQGSKSKTTKNPQITVGIIIGM